MSATETLARVYECHNSACPLGSRKDPGRFTGGITAEALNLKTGEPLEHIIAEGKFGEGYCPECGEKATPEEPNEETGKTGYHDFSTADNADPYQELHEAVVADITAAVADRLNDDSDDTVTKDNHDEVLKGALVQAQPMVEAAVAAQEAEAASVQVAEGALVTDTDDDDHKEDA